VRNVDYTINPLIRELHQLIVESTPDIDSKMGRCGVRGSTLAFGSIGHGFEFEHCLFSHHGASAFSKLRSLRSAH